MTVSRTQLDYIKAIWNLQESEQTARVKTVADILQVKPPTVFSMFRQLARLGYISYDKKRGASLTDTGLIEAQKLIRKHRLIETFLQKVLDLGGPLLHDEAEKLEHVISDQLIMKIDEYLEYPNTDPHGSIIPLSRSNEICYSLYEIEKEIPFKVIRVPTRGDEKEYCSANGLLPGSCWRISGIGPQNESFLLTDGDEFIAVSDHMAQKIEVTILKK